MHVRMRVCVLGSGPEVPELNPPAPPVHPAVIGYLAFAGGNYQVF